MQDTFGDEPLDFENVNTVTAHSVWLNDEEGSEFDGVILDDSRFFYLLELSLRQRFIYLSLDLCVGIKEKNIQSQKIV